MLWKQLLRVLEERQELAFGEGPVVRRGRGVRRAVGQRGTFEGKLSARYMNRQGGG